MAYPLYPYTPRSVSAVAVEVQQLTPTHEMRRMQPHGHTFFEILVVTRGGGRHVVGESAIDLAERTAFVIPPGVIHDCRGFGEADAWVLLFLPDGADASAHAGLSLIDDVPTGMLSDLFRRPVLELMQPIALDDATYRTICDAFERMHAELHGKRPGYEFIVRSALQIVLIELARSAPATGIDADEPRARDLLARVFADIDLHFTERETLAAASRRLRSNPGYLTTRLRRLTGRTYGDWVIERRMIEARRLLAATDLAIGDIAERIGYSESESFVRRFREHHRVTPAAWRAKSRSIGA